MQLGLGRAVPLAAACSALALCGPTPSMAAAQGTGCGFTRLAATAAPETNVRTALRCLVNTTREQHGLPPLRPDERLRAAADSHSADMVARGYFAHVTPEGKSVADRVRRSGYLGRARKWAVGEDIGWGTSTLSSAAAIFDAWMHSPPHRRVILDRHFRQIGIGVALGVPVPGQGDGATFVLDVGEVG
jgi:uncharacterized protein YkwD